MRGSTHCVTTRPTLHPCFNNYLAASIRLRDEMSAAGHGESAIEAALQELIASTATWHHFQSPRDDARFANGVDVLVDTLVGSGGQRGIRYKRRDTPEEFAGSDVCDATAYRLRRWLGILERQVREVSDRQLQERLRYESGRNPLSFDVRWSQLATKEGLTVEDIVNFITDVDPTEPFPYDTQEIGELTYIDLKYRRVLVLPTTFVPTFKRLYPFETKNSKIVKTVRGASHPISIFALRVLGEFEIDKETVERLEKRLVPLDWTSASIQKNLNEMTAEDAERGTLDPVPETRLDSKQDDNLRAWSELDAALQKALAANDTQAIAELQARVKEMEDLSQWKDEDAEGKVTFYPNNPLTLSRVKVINDTKLKAREGVLDVPYALENAEAVEMEDGCPVSGKPARSTPTAAAREGEEQ